MDAKIERRLCKRHACDLPVVWCYFNQNRFHKATQVDCSEGGICLESSSAPHSGATILIKRHYPTIDKSSSKLYKGQREITLAEVRWCRESKESNGSYYRVGASYLSVGYP